MKNFKQKLGFTITELVIVLAVVGVITAILVPNSIDIMPNRNLMKFKKANNTLHLIINQLVVGNIYYKNYLLSLKYDGNSVTNGYLCETMADAVSAKTKNCSTANTSGTGYVDAYTSTLADCKTAVDTACKNTNTNANIAKFITSDSVLWYESNPNVNFANNNLATSVDDNGFYRRYKVFCIDIDGAGGEDPFGYGIRVDGKILTGARADTWLARDIQDKE